VLLKVFRLEPENPLIRKLTFTNSEVDTIIANRYTQAFGRVKRAESYQKSEHKIKRRKKLATDTLW